jgi:hypothetical protein
VNTSLNLRNRGAARHWVFGCLAVVAVLIAVIGIGGYFAYKKVREKVNFGTFDVTSKIDPPATAEVDSILPATAGAFKRTLVTTETAHMRSTDFPSIPGTTDQVTSGMVMATYADPQGLGALVIAVSTEEAKKSDAQRKGPFSSMHGNAQPNQGFHMRVDMGPQPFDFAVWAKQNWTYMVQTTNTAALEFAKGFDPAK